MSASSKSQAKAFSFIIKKLLLVLTIDKNQKDVYNISVTENRKRSRTNEKDIEFFSVEPQHNGC